jgi:hypothetical protein
VALRLEPEKSLVKFVVQIKHKILIELPTLAFCVRRKTCLLGRTCFKLLVSPMRMHPTRPGYALALAFKSGDPGNGELLGCRAAPFYFQWEQLGNKTPRFRPRFYPPSSVRATESLGVMVGAVGIEIASQISKPHRNKALPAAPKVSCCQMLPNPVVRLEVPKGSSGLLMPFFFSW